jgi:transposase
MIKFQGKKIYLACGSTDMRKAINGLAAIIEQNFKLDPFDSALFVFCNGSRDRLKILEWDGDGFWLHIKRLEKGHFRWTSSKGGATMTLSEEELDHLLGNTKLTRKLQREEVIERAIA